MKTKKAQITMFVVIGIVILILVGMVIYFITYSTKRQSQKSVKITQQSTIRTQQVSNFVSSCLEKTAKDGLVLASRQGGYIFTDQRGQQQLATVNYSNKDSYHVAYAITVNEDKLIDLNKGESLADSLSIQSQLEYYINNTIDGCVDFSVLEKQGFEITNSGKNTEVKISEIGIAVNLYYPIDVSYVKTGDKAHYENFNADINVGLNKTYGIANAMVSGNSENPLNITLTDYEEEGILLAGEDINEHIVIIEETPYTVYDQLVMITDSDSKIQGQEHEFWFVKENWQIEPEPE